MREQGSGTCDVLLTALDQAGIQAKELQMELLLDNTESVKQYLLHADCAAFLSLHAIKRELQQRVLTLIDIKGIAISRTFQFVSPRGQATKVDKIFKQFCLRQYNLL